MSSRVLVLIAATIVCLIKSAGTAEVKPSAKIIAEKQPAWSTLGDIRNEIQQPDALTYELGTPQFQILNADEQPEIITVDQPNYWENLRRYDNTLENTPENVNSVKIAPSTPKPQIFTERAGEHKQKYAKYTQSEREKVRFVIINGRKTAKRVKQIQDNGENVSGLSNHNPEEESKIVSVLPRKSMSYDRKYQRNFRSWENRQNEAETERRNENQESPQHAEEQTVHQSHTKWGEHLQYQQDQQQQQLTQQRQTFTQREQEQQDQQQSTHKKDTWVQRQTQQVEQEQHQPAQRKDPWGKQQRETWTPQEKQHEEQEHRALPQQPSEQQHQRLTRRKVAWAQQQTQQVYQEQQQPTGRKDTWAQQQTQQIEQEQQQPARRKGTWARRQTQHLKQKQSQRKYPWAQAQTEQVEQEQQQQRKNNWALGQTVEMEQEQQQLPLSKDTWTQQQTQAVAQGQQQLPQLTQREENLQQQQYAMQQAQQQQQQFRLLLERRMLIKKPEIGFYDLPQQQKKAYKKHSQKQEVSNGLIIDRTQLPEQYDRHLEKEYQYPAQAKSQLSMWPLQAHLQQQLILRQVPFQQYAKQQPGDDMNRSSSGALFQQPPEEQISPQLDQQEDYSRITAQHMRLQEPQFSPQNISSNNNSIELNITNSINLSKSKENIGIDSIANMNKYGIPAKDTILEQDTAAPRQTASPNELNVAPVTFKEIGQPPFPEPKPILGHHPPRAVLYHPSVYRYPMAIPTPMQTYSPESFSTPNAPFQGVVPEAPPHVRDFEFLYRSALGLK